MGVVVRNVLRDLNFKKKPTKKRNPQYDWQGENSSLGNIAK